MLINVHSCYSFKYGILKPEQIILLVKKLGYRKIALTDINSTSGVLSFIRLAKKHKLSPVVGVDFRNDGVIQKYVALAEDNNGYVEINGFLSKYIQDEKSFPDEAPEFAHVQVVYPFSNVPDRPLRSYEWIGVSPSQVNRLTFSKGIDKNRVVLLATATFRDKRDFNLHKLLRAIDLNTIYSKVTPADYGDIQDVFRTRVELKQIFKNQDQEWKRTQELLEKCSIYFDFSPKTHRNKQVFTSSAEEDYKLIRHVCDENLHYRYKNPNQEIYSRVEKELKLIQEKKYISYFLINWDLTKYARDKGYFYVGRGSGANSIIAYLLRITDVDPIELDLYFERFINAYRQTPPDFDIDFSWKDRDDVTEYIFRRHEHVALLATYNSFKYRAAVRELGKVFGLPKEEIDILTADTRSKRVCNNRFTETVLSYAYQMQSLDLPSHLSVHSSGILISEHSLRHYSGVFMPPKGFETVQFDMHDAEDIGLYKFDILGQRGLGKIKDALALVKENNPLAPPIDIHDMARFKSDERIKDLLREGKAIGCFYVESPAMRMLLKKLRVDTYLGLVAASSIIRPGVARSGMMREYILRERDPERRKRAHPILQKIMPDTYGIMVYQEDVIKVAHYYAKLSLAEADVLRRGMSGKYRSRQEFIDIQDKYFSNCKELGYPAEEYKEIWRQIESFAGYAFAKGHSASYAVESYQSLFLKAYYPLEYMVATINNGGGFYRSELYVHEARMCGGIVHPPCVNRSDYTCTIYGRDIYIGLGFIHGLETEVVQHIMIDREQNGPYDSLISIVERIPISLEQLCILIRIDACRMIDESKRKLLWKAHQLLSNSGVIDDKQAKLFSPEPQAYKLPRFYYNQDEETFDQLELLGYPLRDPFALLKGDNYSSLLVRDLPANCGREITIIGYLISVKNTKTSKGEYMNFGTFLDMSGHFLDTVHFPQVAAKFRFRGRGVYEIVGKVVEEFGFFTVEVIEMSRLPYIHDPRFGDEIDALEEMSRNKNRKKLSAAG